MIETQNKVNANETRARRYEIRVRAVLEAEMVEWMGDFEAAYDETGCTLLTGCLPDQAALFGALLRLRDLGLPLISVNPVF